MDKPRKLSQARKTNSQSAIIQVEPKGTPSFRDVARQVLIANSFTRRKTPSTTSSLASSKRNNGKEKTNEVIRPPSVKRRGTPEIFPMSSEMKKTLLLLGKMDLLPEEEEKKHKSATTKFRQKTRMRVINPQRFIRSMKSSDNNNNAVTRNSSEKIEEESENFQNTSLKSDAFVKAELALSGEKSVDISVDITLDSIDVDDGDIEVGDNSSKQMEKRSVSPTPRVALSRANSTQIADSYRRPTAHSLAKTYPSTRNHKPNIRDVALKLTKGSSHPAFERKRIHPQKSMELTQENMKHSNAINHWLSVEELTNDIQDRCSRWFEFRKRLLEQSDSI
ncbi:uncharacterized protein LOC116616929 [Nematostella vectensis]|uniref:uncharacterized protein LOC116616929 n=1 Tax=Nematostella vectensis TaxID=45351 RepID=UPI00138FDC4E|nr:uncharacterized protein LOC116616929 [Nematostella vectensis]